MSAFKKWAFPYAIAFCVGFYTTFVLQSLWNWFAVPALNVPRLSYWGTYGLGMVIYCFKASPGEFVTNEHRWKIAMTMLQDCVRPDREEHVKEELTIIDHGLVGEVWSINAAQFGAQTFTLSVGWLIHTFFV